MKVLEKYNYNLQKYENLIEFFFVLYSYEVEIKSTVIFARETADISFDKLTQDLQIQKDEFSLKFKEMVKSAEEITKFVDYSEDTLHNNAQRAYALNIELVEAKAQSLDFINREN